MCTSMCVQVHATLWSVLLFGVILAVNSNAQCLWISYRLWGDYHGCSCKESQHLCDSHRMLWNSQARALSWDAYHLLVLFFPFSWALWFAIHCRCLASPARHHLLWLSLWFLHLCPAFAFFSSLVCFYADSFPNQPSSESAIPRTPVLMTIRGCSTNFIAFLYKAWQKCAHIYIHTNASSESDCRHQD